MIDQLAASLNKRGIKTEPCGVWLKIWDNITDPEFVRYLAYQPGEEDPTFCFFLLDLMVKEVRGPSLSMECHEDNRWLCQVYGSGGFIDGEATTRTDAVVSALIALDTQEVKA